MTSLHRWVVVFAALVLIEGCGGSGGSTTTGGGNPSLAIGLSPTSGSIAQGANGTITATATGSGGFSGTATVTVTGQPAGVTFAIANSYTAGSVTTASVLIAVGASVATGTYPLTVTASGSGVSNTTATYTLTVTSSTAPGYSLAANPATVSLAQGANGNSTITITRTGGFAGSVALTATGMSSGLTAAFNPANPTGNTSTLTLTTTAGATAGTVYLTIHGTATGLAEQTTTLQATVTTSGGGGGGGSGVTLDFSGCGPYIKPIWLAYQDGTGPWTRVTPVGDVYTFNVSGAKTGWAAVTQSGAVTATAVHMFTTAELAGTTTFCPATTVKTVNVTVAGMSTGLFANLTLGGGNNYALANGPVAIPNVQSGPQDLVAYLTAVSGGPAATDRAVILRDLNVAANGSAGTVDFGGAGAITPAAAIINVAGAVGGDAIVANMLYLTGTSCSNAAMYSTVSSPATALTMYGIPVASQRATDYHNFQVYARNGTTVTRSLLLSFHTFAAQTVTLGAFPATPAVTDLGLAGYKQLRGVGTVSTDYSTSTSLIYTQHGTAISAVLYASQGWLGSQSVTLTFPDFTAVSGWNNAWMPAAGTTADWTWLSNNVGYTNNLCSEGAKLMTGQVTGSN